MASNAFWFLPPSLHFLLSLTSFLVCFEQLKWTLQSKASCVWWEESCFCGTINLLFFFLTSHLVPWRWDAVVCSTKCTMGQCVDVLFFFLAARDAADQSGDRDAPLRRSNSCTCISLPSGSRHTPTVCTDYFWSQGQYKELPNQCTLQLAALCHTLLHIWSELPEELAPISGPFTSAFEPVNIRRV